MKEKQPLLKVLKCFHKHYQKESFTTLKIVLQLSWLTIAMNFVEVFIVIGRMLHFFCAYSMFFSKFGDGYERQHGVSEDDKVEITKLFRSLAYAHNVEGYERAYQNKIFSILRRYKNTKIVCSISKNYVKLANRKQNAFELRN